MAEEDSGNQERTQAAMQEEFMQLRYMQDIYSQQYELIENEIATYSLAQSAIQKNIDLLENANRLNNSKILINGEGGTYIEASIAKVEKVITYIGAGYLIEKDVSEAKTFLDRNKEKEQATMKKLYLEKDKIARDLIGISYRLAAYQQQ